MSFCKICNSQIIDDECINKICASRIKFMENMLNGKINKVLNIEDVTEDYPLSHQKNKK